MPVRQVVRCRLQEGSSLQRWPRGDRCASGSVTRERASERARNPSFTNTPHGRPTRGPAALLSGMRRRVFTRNRTLCQSGLRKRPADCRTATAHQSSVTRVPKRCERERCGGDSPPHARRPEPTTGRLGTLTRACLGSTASGDLTNLPAPCFAGVA